MVIVFLGLAITVSPKNLKTDKGVLFGLLFSILGATNLVLIKKAVATIPPTVVIAIMSFPSVFIFPILMKNSKNRIVSTLKKKWRSLLGVDLFDTGTWFFITAAYQVGKVGIITSVHQSIALVGVLVGIVFLNERERLWQKIVGTVITATGVLFLV